MTITLQWNTRRLKNKDMDASFQPAFRRQAREIASMPRASPFVLGLLMLGCLLFGSSCKPPNVPQMISGDTVLTPSNPKIIVDMEAQTKALKHSDPKRDARYFISMGDVRFIADRPTLPRFFGIPDGKYIYDRMKKKGFKVIVREGNYATSDEFSRLAGKYTEQYNAEIYEYLKAHQLVGQ